MCRTEPPCRLAGSLGLSPAKLTFPEESFVNGFNLKAERRAASGAAAGERPDSRNRSRSHALCNPPDAS
ncbi:hypothetical protein EYF80_027219 [Liparis tanakae]|uniref:Uncharacterized protein n=1 Tax=Liparis tanakae TaxID=230148 RepID=A0A4Z2H9R7_9TELE|nr:hypothetical protein EYF80_027219 [Liparis tanakae]